MSKVFWDPKNMSRPKPSPKHERGQEINTGEAPGGDPRGNDSGLYSFTGLIFIYSTCGVRSDSEVAPGFFCSSVF